MAASCEPGSGYNLPPGCFEGDPNVGTDSPGAEWHAACWARNWVVDHYKDMQEDTCDSFSSC